ncbi:hypothetical protein CYLTODRAFT_453481 [Cylindrobasidium torrendii FP15055 ss-10]|uniref:Uncharacterized protein n=1 Tax=Cylindrobasidium torrendii FP15055 ss-10 TaxID=1314674 RepID=A0A0D7BE96_9AGAR|nr:hypothetical protein CYLTODRAFT_453481 [Cylindrobasidium torrendii FP15055 ss-10]
MPNYSHQVTSYGSVPEALTWATPTPVTATTRFSSSSLDGAVPMTPPLPHVGTVPMPSPASNTRSAATKSRHKMSSRTSSRTAKVTVEVVKQEPGSPTFIMEPLGPEADAGHDTDASGTSSKFSVHGHGAPSEVPLRASQAGRKMRSMMGVFRLNPFAVQGDTTSDLTWCGEVPGPLPESPKTHEWQLDNYDSGIPDYDLVGDAELATLERLSSPEPPTHKRKRSQYWSDDEDKMIHKRRKSLDSLYSSVPMAPKREEAPTPSTTPRGTVHQSAKALEKPQNPYPSAISSQYTTPDDYNNTAWQSSPSATPPTPASSFFMTPAQQYEQLHQDTDVYAPPSTELHYETTYAAYPGVYVPPYTPAPTFDLFPAAQEYTSSRTNRRTSFPFPSIDAFASSSLLHGPELLRYYA